jgi:uncharacterized protein with ParB-like and HNH nuclease domain
VALSKSQIAQLAYEAYCEIREQETTWKRANFNQPRGTKGKPDGDRLTNHRRWALEKDFDHDYSKKLAAPLGEQFVKLDEKDFKKVRKNIEQFRVLEQIELDPIFRDDYETDKQVREKFKSVALLPKHIADTWITANAKKSIGSRLAGISGTWKSLRPLVELKEGMAREIDGTQVYLREHQHDQGPAYKSVADMLKENYLHEIPTYQRWYEWDLENIETLATDLDSCDLKEADGVTPLFLGTILLQDGPTAANRKYVLDGQQRLITISLVCIWAAGLLEANGLNSFAQQIVKKFLGSYDEDTDIIKPKIKPDPRDQAAYLQLLQGVTTSEWEVEDWNTKLDSNANSQLFKQLENIDQVFGPSVHSAGLLFDLKGLSLILLTLLQVCHVCRFVLANRDDPFDTFQRLNHRGKRLENADLLRSIVLKKCKTPTKREGFYRNNWMRFESRVGESSEKEKSQYSKSKLDRFFTCYARSRVRSTKKTRSVDALTGYWKDRTADDITTDLREFLEIYKTSVDFDVADINRTISLFGRGLTTEILRLALVKPPDDFSPFTIAMLELVARGEADAGRVSSCLSLLSSWVVRHHLITQGATSLFGLQNVFTEQAWNELRKSDFNRGVLLKAIDRKEYSPSSLTDIAFLKHLKVESIYGSKIQRAVMFSVDFHKETGHELQKGDNRIKELPVFTIEHVAPKNLSGAKSWKHMKGHEKHLGQLGNLVPVESRLNVKVQRDEFAKKAKEFSLQSNFHLARELKTLPTEPEWKKEYANRWGHEAIQYRTERMAETLVKAFPFPAEKAKA